MHCTLCIRIFNIDIYPKDREYPQTTVYSIYIVGVRIKPRGVSGVAYSFGIGQFAPHSRQERPAKKAEA